MRKTNKKKKVENKKDDDRSKLQKDILILIKDYVEKGLISEEVAKVLMGLYIDVVIFIMQDDVEGVKKAIERVCKDVVESKFKYTKFFKPFV